MRRAILSALCLVLLATPAMTEENKGVLKTRKEKVSYLIGIDMGRRLKSELGQQSIDYDAKIVARAIQETLSGGNMLMTEDELTAIRTALQEELQAKSRERTKQLAEKNKKEGQAFLAANAKKEGVKTTEQGLQFRILTQGKGRIPQMTDTVTVNYSGKLVDGTEFDSSTRRGKPATFSLDQVITGWSKALTLMNEGSKWEIVVPPSLAYGNLGTPGGPIGPDAVLIFEIELLAIGQGPQAAGQMPGTMGK